jgi:3-methylfumaryl-CoA hydratase
MIAGGRMRARRGLEMGRPAVRTAELTAVTPKEGRTGELLFVTVRYEYRQGGELRLVDEQDLVYRSDPPAEEATPGETLPQPGEPASAPVPALADAGAGAAEAAWRLAVTVAPPLLFRFSALTANAHRIHYDQRYCTDVERYPGLVVHGPLLAVLMAELPRRHTLGRRITGLTYRLRRPVFEGEPFVVTGSPESGQLSVQDTSGRLRAEAHFT